MTLTDKLLLIVGGANGIGAAAAKECAARGARVIVADRDVTRGAAAAAACGGVFLPVDVTKEESVRALFVHVAEQGGPLRGLLYTAGILTGAFVPLAEFPASTMQAVWEVNTLGAFLCAQSAAPLLKVAGGGVMVIVSSVAAHGVSSSYAYGASKAALNNLGLALAERLAADGIRVNVVEPGGIDTEMKRAAIAADLARQGRAAEFEQVVRLSGLGDPRGVARVLAWLVSDDADYVRGVVQTR
jgi:3alpha(or 20beta)-hydroxysteroid dehydrogenase